MIHDDKEWRNLVRDFDRDGYLVLTGALEPAQVARFNEAIDRHLQDHPENWFGLGEPFLQAVDVLPYSDAFDPAIENQRTLSVLRRLLGEQITLEEFSIIIRNRSRVREDVKGWHRDIVRDFNRRMEIQAISLIYYLTDVTEQDHCFTIVPGSHNRLLDLDPRDVRPGQEKDIHGPAGTAVFFHARCVHAGKLRADSRQRRTLHLYFARSDQPRTSEWSTIPERLRTREDSKLPPLLYSKWKMTQVVEGTGKKPRDLDPSLSAVEMLKVVQERARAAAKA